MATNLTGCKVSATFAIASAWSHAPFRASSSATAADAMQFGVDQGLFLADRIHGAAAVARRSGRLCRGQRSCNRSTIRGRRRSRFVITGEPCRGIGDRPAAAGLCWCGHGKSADRGRRCSKQDNRSHHDSMGRRNPAINVRVHRRGERRGHSRTNSDRPSKPGEREICRLCADLTTRLFAGPVAAAW